MTDTIPEPPAPPPINRRRLIIVASASLVVILAALGIFTVISNLREGMPSVEELQNFEPQLTTRILDRNGVLLKELYTERRSYVPISETPPCIVQAFLAVEDHKFYEHWGMRPLALIGAVVESALHFDFHPRGASTLTQQLAKNLYYTPQRKLTRKLRELMTAVEIERYYSKDEIMEMYLTQTYFGAGAYGIASAAKTYFSKPVQEITVGEAALLAAIPKSPTRYNPLHFPDKALERRNIVLERMHDVGYINKQTLDSLLATGLDLHPSADHGALGIAPYFTENVRQELNKIGQEFDVDPYRDGLTVYTTLDARLQWCAEQAKDSVLPDLQDRMNNLYRADSLADYIKRTFPDSSLQAQRRIVADKHFVDSVASAAIGVQCAFMVLDPGNGGILAMIGGRDYETSKFNRATQAIRQPGSSFKPFLYATVLDKGVPITTHISNEEIVVTLPNGTIWAPQNFGGDFGGIVDLREALCRSLNVVSVRLVREYTSPAEVVSTARKLGITTRLDPYDAIALGASGVIPIEMVAAYQTFQTLGIWSKPRYITSVTDKNGNVIVSYRPERKVVMREETAFLVQSLLRSVSDIGTGRRLRTQYNFTIPAGGKTGTTNESADAWFIGFTPELVAGVWVGIDDPAIKLGKTAEGSSAALPIWAQFMIEAYDTMNYETGEFRVPPGIESAEICAETGELATVYCPEVRTEYFMKGGVPKESCEKHSGFRVPRKKKTSLF